jgi:hypothetical protein
VAILAGGIFFPVSFSITLPASGPEILIMATPETPGPVDSAYIVMILLYIEKFY